MIGTPEEYPELWRYLASLRPGERLTGTVAGIERFGVFVALDNGPEHPVYAGVGFIAPPELSWTSFDDASEVVRADERVECEFLQFDTWNLEARLSLRATRPDPFASFVESHAVGMELSGRVTKCVPFGFFVRVAHGIEGLVRSGERDPLPPAQPGEDVTVTIAAVDSGRRRLTLARRETPDRSSGPAPHA